MTALRTRERADDGNRRLRVGPSIGRDVLPLAVLATLLGVASTPAVAHQGELGLTATWAVEMTIESAPEGSGLMGQTRRCVMSLTEGSVPPPPDPFMVPLSGSIDCEQFGAGTVTGSYERTIGFTAIGLQWGRAELGRIGAGHSTYLADGRWSGGGTLEDYAGAWTAIRVGLDELMLSGLPGVEKHVWANGHAEVAMTVTALGVTLVGNVGVPGPLPGVRIRLATSPSEDVEVDPETEVLTDSAGVAHFFVRSTTIGEVQLHVSAPADVAHDRTLPITFGRHKIVIQIMGINTALDCSSDGEATPLEEDFFSVLRTPLLTFDGFTANDFLWFSYRGGQVDSETGEWRCRSYSKKDISRRLKPRDGRPGVIDELRLMLQRFAAANPNTDLFVIGHSLGGLIALQALGGPEEFEGDTRLRAIVTMDSPLGGTHHLLNRIAYFATGGPISGWGGASASDVAQLFRDAPDEARRGSSAPPLCCGISNEVLVDVHPDVDVYTFGNRDDAVFDPRACVISLRALRLFRGSDNTSTQVIDSAKTGPGLPPPLGGNVPLPLVGIESLIDLRRRLVPELIGKCILNSHVQIFSAVRNQVRTIVGPQPGADIDPS